MAINLEPSECAVLAIFVIKTWVVIARSHLVESPALCHIFLRQDFIWKHPLKLFGKKYLAVNVIDQANSSSRLLCCIIFQMGA